VAGEPNLIRRLRNSAFAFPLAAAVALGILAISETSYRDAIQSIERVEARQQARVASETVRRTLYEAKSAHRGFLLTGRGELLTRLDAVWPQAAEALAALHLFYDGEPESAAIVAQLDTEIRAQFDALRESARLRPAADALQPAAALPAEALDQGRAESARRLVDRLTSLETERIAASREQLLETLLLSRIGVGALVGLSLLALSMYLRQRATLQRQVADEATRIAEQRDRLEAEASARTAQLRELAQHLQTVREDERSRLARELHDELGALLTAAKLDAARLKSRLAGQTEILDRLAHLNEQLNSGIALKRRIIEDLRPSSLSNLGLVAALEILLREWSQRTEIEVEGDLRRTRRLTPAAELTVFRFVQEALTNIAKYAKATHVQVRLTPSERDPGQVVVCVSDNGIGFDVEASNTGSTHGLLGMRYRVEAEGGTLEVQSRFGEGATLVAHLPVAPTQPSDESEGGDAGDGPTRDLALVG
jgi:signal transduction histidine kinase